MSPSAAGARRLPLRFPTGFLVGGALWVGFVLLTRPRPFDPGWTHALLLLAPLALVPLGLELAEPRSGGPRAPRLMRLAGRLQLPAAALLAVAYLVPQGRLAALLALPWLGVAGLIALAGIERLLGRVRLRPLSSLCLDAGLVYLAIGAAWAVADRLGFRPLDLPAVIVVLTAVHFHYAGFVLPIATGHALGRAPGTGATLAGVGVVAGVPLVALGITATQLGLGPWLETVAAWLMAAAGALVAGLHLRLAARLGTPLAVRALWTVAGFALAGSMVLAALYGSRYLLPVVRPLDIAWMQALHGAANALGFALAGLLGWHLAARLRYVTSGADDPETLEAAELRPPP